MTDGKWHHVCVTWSTRDGIWEVHQDGVKKGSGQNLASWHAIKSGGIFILGQEQVQRDVSSHLCTKIMSFESPLTDDVALSQQKHGHSDICSCPEEEVPNAQI